MKRNRKGFTLIEMVITIVVIITLSAISVPFYKDHGKKAKLAEGYVLLSAIRDAQKEYFSEYGNFLYRTESSAGYEVFTANDEVLGIDARGNTYFTAFSVNTNVAGNGKLDYYFEAKTRKPTSLWNGTNYDFVLQYNISLGQHFAVNKADVDSSWL